MNAKTKLLIPVVAVVAIVAAYWMLLLAPKRQEAAKLATQVQQAQAAAQQAQQTLGEYRKAKAQYPQAYATVTRLGKAVPADDDVRSLLVQVNSAADRSRVDFHTIGVGGASGGASGSGSAGSASSGSSGSGSSGSGSSATNAPPPGAVTVGSAGFAAMPFSLTFNGSFFNLSSFFRRLEQFVQLRGPQLDVSGRLLLVSSLKIAPEQGDLTKTKLSAQVGATSYLLPPGQGLTAGGTASGPAGASGAKSAAGGASPAPSSATTPASTTATVTGVR